MKVDLLCDKGEQMMNGHAIGDRIRMLRREKNMSQQALANALGFNSPATVSAWEHGKGQLTSDMIVGLAMFFGVSTDYLLLGQPCQQQKGETKVILERMTDVKVFESTEWHGLWRIIGTSVLSLLTVILVFLKPHIHEYVLLAVMIVWLFVFMMFAFSVLYKPFKPDKMIYLKPDETLYYRDHKTNDRQAIFKGNLLMIGLLDVLMSLLMMAYTLMIISQIKPVLAADALIVLMALLVMLSVYRLVSDLKSHPMSQMIPVETFHKQASLDLDIIKVLLTGLIFISLFVYMMLYLEEDQRLTVSKAIMVIGLSLIIALVLYALRRLDVQDHYLNIDNETAS